MRNRRRLEGRVRAVSARIKAGKECTRFSCLPLAIESRDGQTSEALTEIAARRMHMAVKRGYIGGYTGKPPFKK